MNSSIQQIINISADCLIVIVSSVNICISIGLLIFLLYHVIKIKNSPNRIGLLLTANLYLSILFCSTMSLIQYSHALPGHFYILISLNDEFYCQIRTYFQMVSLSTIYYSNCLQAIHRLCRIVFYKKRSFQSFQLYKSLIIIQWIVCFLLMIPSLLIGDFVYVENDYYCQIDFRNLRNVLVNGALIYGIPANITIACYIYTLTKLTNATNDQHQRMTQIQQMMARRDMLVIFRICILFALLISGSILSILLLFIYIFTGYLPWWSTQSQWFATISTVTIVSVVLTFAFPDVRNLLMQYFRRHNQIRIRPIALQMN